MQDSLDTCQHWKANQNLQISLLYALKSQPAIMGHALAHRSAENLPRLQDLTTAKWWLISIHHRNLLPLHQTYGSFQACSGMCIYAAYWRCIFPERTSAKFAEGIVGLSRHTHGGLGGQGSNVTRHRHRMRGGCQCFHLFGEVVNRTQSLLLIFSGLQVPHESCHDYSRRITTSHTLLQSNLVIGWGKIQLVETRLIP